MRSQVRFFDARTKRAYESLREGDDANRRLYGSITGALDALEANAFCGVQIPKRIIPKPYASRGIRNVWKHDLPNGWRLIYSVQAGDSIVISLVIEWFDHKNYERRFGYS
ncbi:MAG: hypothetical protein ACMXYM_01495 [Candidatus Woesearchaeota archaeon]